MDNAVNNLARLGLVTLATARLTRLVTEDAVGHWWFVAPARRWANLAEDTDANGQRLSPLTSADWEPEPDNGWRSKLASGIDCRWCVGFWLGAAVLVGEVATRLPVLRVLRPAWTFALGALALNAASNAAGKGLGVLP